MKTKLTVRAGNIAIRFDEKSFLSTILGFTPGWIIKTIMNTLVRKMQI